MTTDVQIADGVHPRATLAAPELDRAPTVVTRLLTQAERVSRRSFRHTATVDA